MMGFTARLIDRINGGENDGDLIYGPGNRSVHANPQLDLKQVQAAALQGCEYFRREYGNLLSVYGPLEGEFGVYEVLGNYSNTKIDPSIYADAIKDGDTVALIHQFRRGMELALYELLTHAGNPLKRLQLVPVWPQEATDDFSKLHAAVTHEKSRQQKLNPPAPAPVPAAETEEEPEEVFESPTEVAARVFREMPSAEFRKWLNVPANKAAYEQACEEGKISL